MINTRRKILGSLLSSSLSLLPPKKGVVVLTLHNIPTRDYEWFESLILYLFENYEFINPFQFTEKDLKKEGPPQILLTFDDGFYSNKVLAEKVLSKYGVKGIFFITEDFIGERKSISFIRKTFYPNSPLVNKNTDKYMPMSWSDVSWLTENGHMIGGHSKSHPVLSSIDNNDKLYDEIISSSNRIEKLIGSNITCFAFPFGTIESINNDILGIANERFKFIFSNIRGNVLESPGRSFIFRQNIVPGDSMSLIKMMVDGHLDWKYKSVRDEAIYKFSA